MGASGAGGGEAATVQVKRLRQAAGGGTRAGDGGVLGVQGGAPGGMRGHAAGIDVRGPSLDHGRPRGGKNKIAR
ncbi:hypothetical protein DIJ63_16040 [Burkholderia pseudomallei]|nr:hypothetical protein DIJ63_16040 [Burkholderia pseudomallei]